MTQTATPEAPNLVTRATAGDTAAFGEIYAANKTLVFRFILKRVRHTPLAEDLTQEVFTRAWKNIGKFDWIGTDIAAWLLRIARNMVADYYRSAYFRKEIPDGSGSRPGYSHPTTSKPCPPRLSATTWKRRKLSGCCRRSANNSVPSSSPATSTNSASPRPPNSSV
jgi:RNA polymerase sigma factor (sigma-70 family)